MSFLETFDQLSYAKVLSITVFMSVVFAVPVGVFLVDQQTRINSRAAYEKPKAYEGNLATPGPVPSQPPQLGRVFPWVGKVGDIVWIQGKHFGINPAQKQLKIGGVVVPSGQIEQWEDELIQAYIPTGAQNGGIVEISVGSFPVSRSLPLTLYSPKTTLKIAGRNPKLMNPDKTNPWKAPTQLLIPADPALVRAIVWTGDDIIPTQEHQISLSPQGGAFDTQGLPILSVALVDASGKAIPYYVDPLEFDF